MQTLTLKSHVGEDGILHLDIPIGLQNKQLEIVLVVQVVADVVLITTEDPPSHETEDQTNSNALDIVSQQWLDAALTEPLPPYDWGPKGVPEGLPVQYVPGQGMVIIVDDEP